jgi:hypothetical protein
MLGSITKILRCRLHMFKVSQRVQNNNRKLLIIIKAIKHLIFCHQRC